MKRINSLFYSELTPVGISENLNFSFYDFGNTYFVMRGKSIILNIGKYLLIKKASIVFIVRKDKFRV